MVSMAKTPEGLIQDAVCQFLEWKRYTFWRQNTVGLYDPTKKIFRAMPKYAMKGVSDIIVLKDGRAMFIEVKSKTGKLSEAQVAFKETVERAGCAYFTVRSVDDLISLGF